MNNTMTLEDHMTRMIQGFNPKFKNEALMHLYYHLENQGHHTTIINDKYLGVDGKSYLLRKKGRMITVKEF